ncbi:MAG: DUF3168 domain-containing protein [Brevundimonas sp.]
MSDPALAVQNAVESALRGSEAVKAAMGLATARLYPLAPPDDALFPYLVIGEDQIIADETECSAGSEVYVATHVWTRIEDDVSGSRAQAKQIAGAVRTAIGRDLNVIGFDLVECRFEDTRHMTDPDKRTAHAVVTHRLMVEPL